MPYGLRPTETYAVLPIQQLDKWEKLTDGKLLATITNDEFNDMYAEVWKWNTLHLNETNYKIWIKYIGSGLFNVLGKQVGM